jgi:hypothetical protein
MSKNLADEIPKLLILGLCSLKMSNRSNSVIIALNAGVLTCSKAPQNLLCASRQRKSQKVKWFHWTHYCLNLHGEYSVSGDKLEDSVGFDLDIIFGQPSALLCYEV